MIHGIIPGPRDDRQAGLFWGMIAMWIGSLMLIFFNLPMVGTGEDADGARRLLSIAICSSAMACS
jgi:TctA family transporter